MALTIGSAPFGSTPSGTFNFDPAPPEHVLYLEPSPRRVRVRLGEETVANSTGVRLLHLSGQTPIYLFPREDVRADLFTTSDTKVNAPGLGEASHWTVSVGERTAEDGAYSYEQPPSSLAGVAGLVAFDWDAMDAWFEEDEEVFVHPRDPYHRIDVLRSSRHVVVRWGDTVVADSTQPRMLLESSLPPRWYLPAEDVRTDLLAPSYTATRCPYKGVAQYRTLRDGDRFDDDVVWSYPEPMHDAEAVGGLLCFDDARLDVQVREGTR
ncbi:DUF427 domain-containing protein [Blastococcus sp. BMG 814]|uniref:DUF427 domain-containing protein n=1 Tax=Blastococcus carthaginiensis TaxID=3050034 RepID=A0ABT9IBU5_9ACTN|nr:DUF427 domain-containing protein [Blastococcus carthaginiensis]MDP5182620.1 DUF427 domain-containing protein [Blastococcus carthaginiensis]